MVQQGQNMGDGKSVTAAKKIPSAPRLAQDALPVLMSDLGQFLVSKAMSPQRGDELGEARNISELIGHGGTVKI